MAFKTFPFQERYGKNRASGGTEPKKKLKKLKSVKVANLDRLRLSMRRDNSKLNQSLKTSSNDDASTGSSSEPSSTPISGTSSPNYMRATTSSSARKGTVSASTGRLQSGSEAGKKSQDKSGSKSNQLSVEECSDPAGVNIPVEIKSGKGSNLRRTRKLSSSKSMKIRMRYSQFPDGGFNEPGTSSVQNPEFDHDGLITDGAKQKGILERSRSIKLTRLRSIRSSRRRQKSRLGAEMSAAQPHYMKDTTSQEARKNSAKGLTRTSSLRPLRILAKIPSLRPRRSKVKKWSEYNVDRATCSSTLKSSKMPDHIELHSGGRESEGISSYHVCPYSYCSLHGQHHHAPSLPIKEFISAKRQLLSNQKEKQLEDQSNTSVEIVTTERAAAEEVRNAKIENDPVIEDDGVDYLIKIYAKPRKKWFVEGAPVEYVEASDHDWKLTEVLCETSRPEARQKGLSDGQPESYQIFSPDEKTQQQTSEIVASNSTLELPDDGLKSEPIDERVEAFVSEESGHFARRDSEVSNGGNLINILSDRRKYTSIWHLIYQQLVSSESSMEGNPGVSGVDEKERDRDANTCREMNDLDVRQSKCNNDLNEEDNQALEMEKVEFDQNAAIKMVQEALTAILQHEEQSSDQKSIHDHEMPLSLAAEHTSTPMDSSEENFRESGEAVGKNTNLEKEDETHKLEQISVTSQQKSETNEEMKSGRKMSKSTNKLRKLIVTAKFIKAMERMRKINPRKPQLLGCESTTEEERVYLRHLSMRGRKNDEEWMLDYALRKAISRLAPDEQRRVAQLVEAFETVNPEQKEKGIGSYPIKGESAPSIELTNEFSISDEQVPVQIQDGEVSVPPLRDPEERGLSEADTAGSDAQSDKVLRACGETNNSNSTLESCENKPRSASIDAPFEEPNMGNKETMTTPEVQPQLSTQDSEVRILGDMTTFLFDKHKYQSMWSLIYQHVVSSETSMDTEKGVNELDETKKGGQETEDLDSTQSSNSTHHDEDEDNQSADGGKHEFNQSAAIILVREAVNAILQQYEQSSDQQFSPYQDRAIGDDKERVFLASTYTTGEHPLEGRERVVQHTFLEPKDKLHQMENSDEVQQQVEPNDSKTPQNKFSKSYSKLKKAIVTAKFIKAIERLRKINPQKSQLLNQEAASAEERVYLRHLSMDGRKNEEEWMLDYALRQVIYKLAPDQQRRVGRLVEAFETVTPEQKERNIRFYSSKSELLGGIGLTNPTKQTPRQFVATLRGRSISDEVPQKQDGVPQKQDGVLHSHLGTCETIQHDDNDYQERAADDTIEQESDETAVSYSTLDLSEGNPKSAYDGVMVEETSSEHEITMSKVEVPSQIEGDSDSIAGDMRTILSDKHKYNSMWHLIYQHVASSEASFAGNEVASEVGEDEDDDADKCRKTNGPDSNQTEEKTNQSAACEKQELNQTAAIKLVKDAITAILQHHEHISKQKSLQDHDLAASNTREICHTSAPASMHIISEPENKMHTIEKASVAHLEQVQPIEEKTARQGISKSKNRLKKLIMTTKFIKAMERLRRTSPRNWSPETTSEEERVKLRHQNTNQKRSAEEWMLDYALRKVISNLAPDQQKKVAQLVGAFEAVTPEQKANSIVNRMKLEPAPAIITTKQIVDPEHENSTSCEALIPPEHEDQLNSPGKVDLLERSQIEDHPIEIPNFRKELRDRILDSDGVDSPIHPQVIPKVRRKEEAVSNPMTESLQQAYSSKKPKQEREANTGNGLFSDAQKHTTMWYLIYQHLTSVSNAETGNKQGERVANEDRMMPGSTLSETIADPEIDDNDASSVASELTESDAIKLVKEAINNILDRPQELDDKSLSSEILHVSEDNQRAAGEKRGTEETPEKSLTRAYSKLRKLIICNKFIKAMEKTRKPHPGKHKKLELDSDGKPEKAHLKPSTVGEKKSSDAWMLDNALQKAIDGVQRRRVAMLVEAFEKVNPNLEDMNKGSCCNITRPAYGVVSAGNAKEKQGSIFESSQKLSELQDQCDFKLEEPLATSSKREVFTSRALVEINEEKTPSSSGEYALIGQDCRNDDPYRARTATSDVVRTISDVSKDIEEMPHLRVSERSPIDEKLVEYSGSSTEFAAEPSQPEDIKDVWNGSTETNISSDRERYTSLWCLLVKHINSDVSENMEKQKSSEIDANEHIDSENILLRKNDDNPDHLFPEYNEDNDKEAQTPKSMSIEFQEQEAIKLVEEALHDILLPEDPGKTCNDQIMKTSATSDQQVYDENHGDGREPLFAATAFSGLETLQDTAVTPQENNTSAKENLPNSSNKLSKVILCRRFIKAMDKMRKLKQQSPAYHVEQIHSKAESRKSVRHIVPSDKKSWEEWMLDHAMQQVVGKLAPAQKKKVSLLVQAFETISSQPEPGTSKAAV